MKFIDILTEALSILEAYDAAEQMVDTAAGNDPQLMQLKQSPNYGYPIWQWERKIGRAKWWPQLKQFFARSGISERARLSWPMMTNYLRRTGLDSTLAKQSPEQRVQQRAQPAQFKKVYGGHVPIGSTKATAYSRVPSGARVLGSPF